ncbi:TetR/AcrR family transcriptional regulator C-terminal domain-containing protein [Frankia sp. AiPs1]|uniref:TetR/AcrR family transcriptional regulator n=1 Tax=Frankia sp. AiPs1 TaxID=573493 RepID=UPI0020441C67|nr:TetR/AcrR family transcriptional regulator C-terminal domain-containing protein [Frankia sp. AiPs1]MCM3921451.1 TetR/AcrR family transcriptional regulator C-terminal domain-containing protein [Frankia sp. AiPs1]
MVAPTEPAVGPGGRRRAGQGPPPGCRSTLSPERLALAAIELADAEGLAAVTMRRLAASLGVGTMTLYYHVRDKDELLDLMWNEFLGGHLLDDIPADWRTALTEIAQRIRQSFQRHPWALGVAVRPALGPNKLRYLEQYLTVASRITDDPDEQLRIIHSVTDLVVGCTLRELSGQAYPGPDEPAGDDDDRPAPLLEPQPGFDAIVAAEELPRLRSLRTIGCRLLTPRFEQALGWLLDGIEAAHPSARPARPHPVEGPTPAADLVGTPASDLVGTAASTLMLPKKGA